MRISQLAKRPYLCFSRDVNNFQGVGKASLQYRLVPRIFLILFLTIVISIAVFAGLTILTLTKYELIAAAGIGICFVLASVTSYITAYLEYSNLQFAVEENSLMLKEGVLSVDTETIPFQKIRNASFTQNFFQRLYHVGNVIIEQDPESYTWESIDQKTAQQILEAVSQRSNIQPIAVSPTQPNPYQAPQQ